MVRIVISCRSPLDLSLSLYERGLPRTSLHGQVAGGVARHGAVDSVCAWFHIGIGEKLQSYPLNRFPVVPRVVAHDVCATDVESPMMAESAPDGRPSPFPFMPTCISARPIAHGRSK
jgi:hypothetical protein